MGLRGGCIAAVMIMNQDKVWGLERPMLAVLKDYDAAARYIYMLVLIGAIFTTALGNGFGAVKWLEDKVKGNSLWIKIIFLFAAGCTSFFGFSGFVEKIYPLFGYLGLLEMFFITVYWIKK